MSRFRPSSVRAREQPFYHLLAENEDSSYVAYVSQQNLLQDTRMAGLSTIRA